MMFSKLSIFIVASLAAFATAASLPQAQGDGMPHNVNDPKTDNNLKESKIQTQTCPTGPVECCTNKHVAAAADVDIAREKLGVAIVVGTDIWTGCSAVSQGQTCATQPVCCDKTATDGSVAIGCRDTTA